MDDFSYKGILFSDDSDGESSVPALASWIDKWKSRLWILSSLTTKTTPPLTLHLFCLQVSLYVATIHRLSVNESNTTPGDKEFHRTITTHPTKESIDMIKNNWLPPQTSQAKSKFSPQRLVTKKWLSRSRNLLRLYIFSAPRIVWRYMEPYMTLIIYFPNRLTYVTSSRVIVLSDIWIKLCRHF